MTCECMSILTLKLIKCKLFQAIFVAKQKRHEKSHSNHKFLFVYVRLQSVSRISYFDSFYFKVNVSVCSQLKAIMRCFLGTQKKMSNLFTYMLSRHNRIVFVVVTLSINMTEKKR